MRATAVVRFVYALSADRLPRGAFCSSVAGRAKKKDRVVRRPCPMSRGLQVRGFGGFGGTLLFGRAIKLSLLHVFDPAPGRSRAESDAERVRR